MLNKDDKKELLIKEKQKTLEKNKNLIAKYKKFYDLNEKLECNLEKDKIYIKFCETKEDKNLWHTFVHLTTSLPYRGAVGRQIKLFIYCKNHIIGMVHLTSPLAQLKLRDKYLKWTHEEKWKQKKINSIYNIETCVPTRKYAQYLTGKLLIYCIFSNEIKEYIKNKYGEEAIGFETTSLYGKSSMYNRLPFFKYLGLTEGNSAMYISDDNWKKVLNEYYEVYPNTKTNRLAPVKFQIVDKLSKYYKKTNRKFPYDYKKVEYKRGIYFGYLENKNLNSQIDTWKKRWFLKRKEKIKNETRTN
jgi:hypothetical protein